MLTCFYSETAYNAVSRELLTTKLRNVHAWNWVTVKCEEK